jgi:Rieske Fe-S protein
VHAFSSTCTHLGCTVNKVTKGKIYCPCHGSVFSAQSGAVEQGPATRPLPAVQVTVRNGMVYRA